MGGIRSQAPNFTSLFMILVLASVALPSTFNFVGEFTVLYSLSETNIWFAILGGTTIILGAYYMLKMFQNSMLGETNAKIFSDITLNEGVSLTVIVAVLFFFGFYPKPILDLITPSLESILVSINRFG
jgi:NADH-quinone oxidoreductase subunit M